MSEQKIIQGDCLEVMKTFPDKSFDLVLTDPPYGINVGENTSAKEGRPGLLLRKKGYKDYADTVKNFDEVVVPAIKECFRVAHRVMIFAVPPNMWKFPAPDAIGGVFVPAAVGRNKWGWTNFIHCLMYGSAPDVHLGSKPTGINVHSMAEKFEHPTVKPLSWLKWAVNLGSRPNERILDPFMGSGTTLVAAKLLNRNATGIEISPEYCKIAEDRLRQGVLL